MKKSPNKQCRCGQRKKQWQLVCRVCWAMLPKPLRDEVWAAYKEMPGSGRHIAAIRACFDHPHKPQQESNSPQRSQEAENAETNLQSPSSN